MLGYDRIYVSEGIYTNKTVGLRECIFFIKCICHYRYIFKINFRFQPKVCNGCHDMTQKSTNLNDFATVTVKGSDYKVNFWFMAKSEAVDRMKNAYLSKKNRTNTKIKKYLL